MLDVQPYLQRIVERFSQPGVQTSLKGFTRALLFRFTDTHEDWLIRVMDGREATLVKESMTNPDVTIITTTETSSLASPTTATETRAWRPPGPPSIPRGSRGGCTWARTG